MKCGGPYNFVFLSAALQGKATQQLWCESLCVQKVGKVFFPFVSIKPVTFEEKNYAKLHF